MKMSHEWSNISISTLHFKIFCNERKNFNYVYIYNCCRITDAVWNQRTHCLENKIKVQTKHCYYKNVIYKNWKIICYIRNVQKRQIKNINIFVSTKIYISSEKILCNDIKN